MIFQTSSFVTYCTLNKNVQARKKDSMRWDSNPGPYGLQLLHKTIALNKHSCFQPYIRYIKTSLFTLKPQNLNKS